MSTIHRLFVCAPCSTIWYNEQARRCSQPNIQTILVINLYHLWNIGSAQASTNSHGVHWAAHKIVVFRLSFSAAHFIAYIQKNSQQSFDSFSFPFYWYAYLSGLEFLRLVSVYRVQEQNNIWRIILHILWANAGVGIFYTGSKI